VDTAVYIAAALGVPREGITWKEANSGQRQQLLESGQVDLIVSTFSITDERKKEVDFAGPYFVAHQDLLVRRNDTEITGPEALDGKNLCSVAGTTSAAYVTSHFLGNIKLVELPRFSDCVTALANSEVDAVTTDDVILAGFAAEPQYQGKLKVVGKGFSDEVYGVGVKKGNTALVDKVNAALRQYIDDGSWKKSLDANVRPSGYSIPSPPTPSGA
jgi:glutamate transport system substrate-binding protein